MTEKLYFRLLFTDDYKEIQFQLNKQKFIFYVCGYMYLFMIYKVQLHMKIIH